MEAKAHIKHVRISPTKLRMITDSVKELKPLIALDRLGVSQNRSAKILYKAIKSAMDNGTNNHGMNAEHMQFKVLSVDEGRFLKRFRPGARGMAKPYLRKSSHITVVLNQPGVAQAPKKEIAPKSETKEVEKKAEDKKVAPVKKETVKKAVAKKTTVKKTEKTEKSVTSKSEKKK